MSQNGYSLLTAPAPITVGNRIVRIQPNRPPFQIINQSLTATVWVSQNPSMTPGNGTPVSSGTSLTWINDGDIYLIVGDDASSVAAGTAAVIISYDVADWSPNPVAVATAVLNSGVLIVDQPVTLYNAVLNPPNSGFIDVSRYQSIDVSVVTNANNRRVDFEFWNDITGIVTDAVHRLNIYSQSNWAGSIPVRGKYLRITTTAQVFLLSVVGSFRPLQNIVNYPNFTDNLLLVSNQVLLAGATGTAVFTAPYFGEVEVHFFSLSTTVAGGYWQTSQDGGTTHIYNINMNPATANSGTWDGEAANVSFINVKRMSCWGKQLWFRPVVGPGAGATMAIQVMPLQPR